MKKLKPINDAYGQEIWSHFKRARKKIAYTGDFRTHGKKAEDTKRFLKKAKEADILITEGTRVSREEQANVTEEQVSKNCLSLVREADKLVIADFDARNFERLETFAETARKTGRKIVVTPRDAYFRCSISLTEGNCVIDNNQALIYHVLKGEDKSWEKSVRWKWGEYYVTPGEIFDNPDKYVLCFSFYDARDELKTLC
jgi:ribonuclease J